MGKNLEKNIKVIIPSAWEEYSLLDSGNNRRLEKFGGYKLIRPEKQAIWKPGLNQDEWDSAHAEFMVGKGEKGGHWEFKQPISHAWTINYKNLVMGVQANESRNLGVFPENATHWDWLIEKINSSSRQINVLNLFGYTGIATIAAASAGASVTHVDASRAMVKLGQENQVRSGLTECNIRWIVDDVGKFVKREIRRGKRYDGILMDPPKFGRGPKGEVWEVMKMFPWLLEECSKLLVPDPLFFLITVYAAPISPLTLENLLDAIMQDYKGQITVGEMGILEKSMGRTLPTAIYARWSTTGKV